MEASSSAHHCARKLVGSGPGCPLHSGLRPARQGAENDANDAVAICEAASRPQMHFVLIKNVEQQSMLCVHRLREG